MGPVLLYINRGQNKLHLENIILISYLKIALTHKGNNEPILFQFFFQKGERRERKILVHYWVATAPFFISRKLSPHFFLSPLNWVRRLLSFTQNGDEVDDVVVVVVVVVVEEE